MTLSVTIPPEPDDRAVVLDRDADAWQRRGKAWHRVEAVVQLFGSAHGAVESWSHLVVDRGPLALLVTEAEEPVDGWARAGYTDPSLEHYAQPIEASTPRHERTDATAADVTSRREDQGDGLPRVWHDGDPEPEDVAEVRDGDSHVWHRLGGDEMRHPWVRDDQRDDASWDELVTHHGPVVEPIPHADDATAALPPQGRFLESTTQAPTFPPLETSPAWAGPLPRPIVDRPQA